MELAQLFLFVPDFHQRNKDSFPNFGALLNLLDVGGDITQGCLHLVKILEGLFAADLSADEVAVHQLLFGYQTDLRAADCAIMLCLSPFLLD